MNKTYQVTATIVFRMVDESEGAANLRVWQIVNRDDLLDQPCVENITVNVEEEP